MPIDTVRLVAQKFHTRKLMESFFLGSYLNVLPDALPAYTRITIHTI